MFVCASYSVSLSAAIFSTLCMCLRLVFLRVLQFDYDFLHTAQVQGYTVRLPSAPTVWEEGKRVLKGTYNINCDGEVLRITHPEFQVKLHRHAIRVFGETIV